MKTLSISFLGAVTLSFSAWTSAADAVAEKPQAKPGEFREYADRVLHVKCKRWEIKEEKDGNVIAQCEDKLLYLDAASYNPVKVIGAGGGELTSFKPHFPDFSFPLTVGKKWNGKYTGFNTEINATWSGDVACEVKAHEKVKVPTG